MTDERDDAELACIDAVELLTDYLEDALPAAQARRLERHLETCRSCTEYLEQMRAVAGALEGFAGDSIPAEMRAKLIAAFRRP
jgi:anti-sigma factor RsiW